MTILSAENNYKEGLVALVEGRPEEARDHFQAAIRAERWHGVEAPQMRYLSYFGLSLALSGGPGDESLEACRTAARGEPRNANLFLNLGRVELMSGRVRESILAFKKGLELEPRHAGLKAALGRTDRRKTKAFLSLTRKHPVSYWLGKARSTVQARRTG